MPVLRGSVRRLVVLTAGTVLLLVGVALLVLPGPGLLLVFAGLVLLAREVPALERHVEPARARALRAAEESVATPLRIAGSVLAGLALLAAGVVWGVRPELPLGGWATGAGLILSGCILLGLLWWSHRNARARRRSP
ncbi:PGPGW domain-containing protein [Streptomyces sp. Z26]|uniref:PGPGW domain-containing protein n=1 Tax=Streptomyces TaxID=1883 RepID=UPI000EF15613|nr:PGPGW domain-containing protein [Streptomyces sp. Z26]RLL69451.1 hypothetical protein D7M15_24415 [Streptomyces sp. Z26]